MASSCRKKQSLIKAQLLTTSGSSRQEKYNPNFQITCWKKESVTHNLQSYFKSKATLKRFTCLTSSSFFYSCNGFNKSIKPLNAKNFHIKSKTNDCIIGVIHRAIQPPISLTPCITPWILWNNRNGLNKMKKAKYTVKYSKQILNFTLNW